MAVIHDEVIVMNSFSVDFCQIAFYLYYELLHNRLHNANIKQ